MPNGVRRGYDPLAIVLHWTMALLILAQAGLGFFMNRLAGPRLAFDLIQWHKSFGFVILALAALRLGWRIAHPAPKFVLLPRWERATAAGVHRLLYALFFLVPLSGWLLVSASVLEIPTLLFGLGLVLVPHLPIGVSETGETFWRSAHHWLAWLLLGLVFLHVLAALRHHFVLRDETLTRMLRPAGREGDGHRARAGG